MSVREIIEYLTTKAFQPPLSKLLRDPRSVPEVLRIPILVIVHDTALCMGGMIGFLDHFGGYLVDTIDALETISAHKTAHTLRTIQQILSNHGVTVEDLMYGWKMPEQMEEQVDREFFGKSYLWSPLEDPAEPVLGLLEAYLQDRRNELVAVLESVDERRRPA